MDKVGVCAKASDCLAGCGSLVLAVARGPIELPAPHVAWNRVLRVGRSDIAAMLGRLARRRKGVGRVHVARAQGARCFASAFSVSRDARNRTKPPGAGLVRDILEWGRDVLLAVVAILKVEIG